MIGRRRWSMWSAAVFVLMVAGIRGRSLCAQRVAVDRPAASVPTEVMHRLITLDLDHVSVERAIKAITAAANVRVSYTGERLDRVQTFVTLHVKQLALGDAFDAMLRGTGLHAELLSADLIAIKATGTVIALRTGGTITGTVTDARTKQPLRGAKIGLDGVDRVVETGNDGVYRLLFVSAGSHTVTVKLIGYTRVARIVVVEDNEAITLNVALEQGVNTLDQVVVTGVVVPTELKAVPSAITVITAKQIEERGITRIDQLFRGDVPGVFAQNRGTNDVFGGTFMFSRGASSIGLTQGANTDNYVNTNPMKTYVDGVELAEPAFLSHIDPQSIERIEILTGPQASTIYGSNAINGVMQIFTKRGTTAKPQFTFNLLSGFVENNLSSAWTPQHDYSAQVSGLEGHMSYNVGGGWSHLGAWNPTINSTTESGFGGIRLEHGTVTADANLRVHNYDNQQRGSASVSTVFATTGVYAPVPGNGLQLPLKFSLDGQTWGFSVGYQPSDWWSHEFVLGKDVAENGYHSTGVIARSPSDTLVVLLQNRTERSSIRYSNTLRISPNSVLGATLTAGADAWQKLYAQALNNGTAALTGSLTGTTTIQRQPNHDTGVFGQGQLDLWNVLFVTAGLRAEWNPNYGKNVEPDIAPRYGVALTKDIGALTTKLRASYGSSTRPALGQEKAPISCSIYGSVITNTYGFVDCQLANPNLGPEYQRGGEGGIELYFGRRGSINITRYNQTVDRLVAFVYPVDSTRSLLPNPPSGTYTSLDAAGYGYLPLTQYLNVGSIRNQGWEMQGALNTGPLTTHGTYSWTKSRVLGITERYKAAFPATSYPQYQPGASFKLLPEHTWAVNVSYAQAKFQAMLDWNGTGLVYKNQDDLSNAVSSSVRLVNSRSRMNTPPGYVAFSPSYTVADLNLAYRVSSGVESVLQVNNLANYYQNDLGVGIASMGRQFKFGLRLHH